MLNINKSEDKLHIKEEKQANKTFISVGTVETAKANKNQAGLGRRRSL